MPKLLFFGALLFLIFEPLLAQTRLGLRIGANSSTIKTHGPCFSGCDLASRNRVLLLSYQIGVTSNRQLNDRLSLDIDLVYAKRGYEQVAFRQSDKMVLNYLSLPLNLNFQFKDSNIDFLLGMETAYLLSATNRIDEQKLNASRLWRDLDIGANLGVAYYFPSAFRVKFGYFLGFFSVDGSSSPRDRGLAAGGSLLRTRSFYLAAYYYLFG